MVAMPREIGEAALAMLDALIDGDLKTLRDLTARY